MKYKYFIFCFVFCLQTTCKKDVEKSLPDFYMNAKINKLKWEPDLHEVKCYIEYKEQTEIFNMFLRSESSDTIEDGVRYQINIAINNTLLTGKHFFNNEGSIINSNNGAIGIVHGWLSYNYFLSHSINGFIEIEEQNDDYILGEFEFDAPLILNSDTIDMIRITDGMFCAPVIM